MCCDFSITLYMRLFSFYPQASYVGESHSLVPATERLSIVAIP
jgi:hypothetical protein